MCSLGGGLGERHVDLVHVGNEVAVEEVAIARVLRLHAELGAGKRDQLVPVGLGQLAPAPSVVGLLEDRQRLLDGVDVVAQRLLAIAGRRLEHRIVVARSRGRVELCEARAQRDALQPPHHEIAVLGKERVAGHEHARGHLGREGTELHPEILEAGNRADEEGERIDPSAFERHQRGRVGAHRHELDARGIDAGLARHCLDGRNGAGGEAEHAHRLALEIGHGLDRAALGHDGHIGRAVVVAIDQRQRQSGLALLGRNELEDPDITDVGVAGDQELQGRGRARDPEKFRRDADLLVQAGAGAGIEISVIGASDRGGRDVAHLR